MPSCNSNVSYSKGLQVARVTEAAADLADFGRAIEIGVDGADEAIQAGKNVDGLLSAKTLDTRGRLGTKFDKNNNVIIRAYLTFLVVSLRHCILTY